MTVSFSGYYESADFRYTAVLLPRGTAGRWRGSDADGGGHYQAACSISGWLGKVEIDGIEGAAFGHIPTRTAWIEAEGGWVGCFWRWVYAPEDFQYPLELDERNLRFAGEVVQLPVRKAAERHLLLNAASRGCEALEEPHIELTLPAGNLRILTAEYKPDSETSFILHPVIFG